MATKIYHLRLADETADRLRKEGGGRIPEGIRTIIRLLDRYNPPEREDPILKRARTKTELAEATKAANYRALAVKFLPYEITEFGAPRDGCPYTLDDLHEFFPEEEIAAMYAQHEVRKGEQAKENAERIRQIKENARREAGELLDSKSKTPTPAAPMPKQTKRLNVDALRRMELFGTPEHLTDAQINELNEYYANTPAPAEDTNNENKTE